MFRVVTCPEPPNVCSPLRVGSVAVLAMIVICGSAIAAPAGSVFSVGPGGPSGLIPSKIYKPTSGPPIPFGGGIGSGLTDFDDLDALATTTNDEEWIFCWSAGKASIGVPSPPLPFRGLGGPRGSLPPFNLFGESSAGQQGGDGFVTTEGWARLASGPIGGLGINNNLLAINQGGGGVPSLGIEEYGLLPNANPGVGVPAGTPQDEVNAEALPQTQDALGPIYFSLSGGSPSLSTLPSGAQPSGADIFFDPDPHLGGNESLFADAPQLGLIEDPDPTLSDDIDALAVRDADGDGHFNPIDGDWVIFSLTQSSPSLVPLDAVAGDLLIIDDLGLRVLARHFEMGLEFDDELDGVRTIGLIGGSVESTLDAIFASTPPCPGDLNGDGFVDLVDLNILLKMFGEPSAGADLDGSGIVDLPDLNIVLANFGLICTDRR